MINSKIADHANKSHEHKTKGEHIAEEKNHMLNNKHYEDLQNLHKEHGKSLGQDHYSHNDDRQKRNFNNSGKHVNL
jgi:hypothetical protein